MFIQSYKIDVDSIEHSQWEESSLKCLLIMMNRLDSFLINKDLNSGQLVNEVVRTSQKFRELITLIVSFHFTSWSI